MNRLSILSNIEGIKLGVGKGIYKVAGRASSMDLDGIDEIGYRSNEVHAAGMYGADFAMGFLIRGLKYAARIRMIQIKLESRCSSFYWLWSRTKLMGAMC